MTRKHPNRWSHTNLSEGPCWKTKPQRGETPPETHTSGCQCWRLDWGFLHKMSRICHLLKKADRTEWGCSALPLSPGCIHHAVSPNTCSLSKPPSSSPQRFIGGGSSVLPLELLHHRLFIGSIVHLRCCSWMKLWDKKLQNVILHSDNVSAGARVHFHNCVLWINLLLWCRQRIQSLDLCVFKQRGLQCEQRTTFQTTED